MTSELRPAVEVATEICGCAYADQRKRDIAVIEADREAVRAPLLAEIERLTIQLEVESEPSPYCPICGSCGEDGCCGPQRCLYPTAEQAAELAKFKALAETLAGALEEIQNLHYGTEAYSRVVARIALRQVRNRFGPSWLADQHTSEFQS
ncbi:hypothetical protein ACQKOE_13705 [Novosphingobium sp. NPDC080210]|uniref:hypothetical protein n=1 Tax=Novosphingobium sp. NPDC080210 TaxID=3390596 RepID=UPI003D028558